MTLLWIASRGADGFLARMNESKFARQSDGRLSASAGAGRRHILALAMFLFFTAAGATGYAEGAGTDKLFEQLGDGQSVRVVFHSEGCFHNETYEFEFRRAPALVATIAQVETLDVARAVIMEPKRVTLGTVDVTDDEAAGLDRLLQFYRSPPQGMFSTTQEQISITLLDGEKALSTEQYSDGSSGASTARSIKRLTLFTDLTRKLAMEICKRIAGYERFIKSFEITDASVDNSSFIPGSLFVMIKPTHPSLIDSVSWWNPLVDGKPSSSWDDFIKSHAAAEAAMARHPWLREWKNLPGGGRSLNLGLLGAAIGVKPSLLETDVLPVWRHAGFSGEPAYHLLAYRKNGWDCVALYFSDKDERALVTQSGSPDPKSPSMMERADVSWSPDGKSPDGKAEEEYTRYAIIENDGRCHVETFVAEPPKPESSE